MKNYLTLVLSIWLFGCTDNESHEHPAFKTGKELFAHHCQGCHGERGQGNFLKGVPANVKTQKTQLELIAWLKNSEQIPRAMPSFEAMTDAEAVLIIEHLNYLKFNYQTAMEKRLNNDGVHH
ncbi:c-type cytochrome [Pseudoalteromonas luteoviolacea]|uniref:c-type cytochrome n=1 Tax=Pseudoalteromonas luteoviolacea TaxID=43657 RepID=UPI001B39C4E1|nr:cytochrome c [Pseudoalteromonas luteoviolacea]MBQ4837156.1 cytochrome c [Pseudoalteromonas luteoviolacea]